MSDDLIARAKQYLDERKTATKDVLKRGLWSCLTPEAQRLIAELKRENEELRKQIKEREHRYMSVLMAQNMRVKNYEQSKGLDNLAEQYFKELESGQL
jgi:TRAP-type C4-dicarboxylate transport system substrate-binding protein